MDAGFPIDKNTLQQIWHESNVFPEAAIEDIVNLHRLELPVTEENLTQMASYRNLTHQLTEGITAVAESLNSTLQGLTTNGEIEQAATIYGHILELLFPEKRIRKHSGQPYNSPIRSRQRRYCSLGSPCHRQRRQ